MNRKFSDARSVENAHGAITRKHTFQYTTTPLKTTGECLFHLHVSHSGHTRKEISCIVDYPDVDAATQPY
jgi:hypothetical protein